MQIHMQFIKTVGPDRTVLNWEEYNDVVFVLEKSPERPNMAMVLVTRTAISIKKVIQLCLKHLPLLLVTRIWKENSTEESTIR